MNIVYPRVEAAAALSREALSIARDEKEWRKRAAYDAARVAERAAFAEELLPSIFPGTQWAASQTWIGRLLNQKGRYDSPLMDLVHDLLDHGAVFRRRGSRGPTTWGNAAIIGQPYNAFGNGGEFQEAAIAEARLLAELGVGVWISRELSTWYPGWTSLVVAAHGLQPQEAEKHGFLVLA
jgi:hypothetical protein